MKTMKWLLGVAVAAAIVVPLQSANAEGGGLSGGGSDGVTRLGDYRGDDDGVYRVHYRGHRGYYGHPGYYGRPWYGDRGPVRVAPPPYPW